MLVAIFMITNGSFAQKPEWQKLNVSRGHFSIMMPGKPEMEKKDSEGNVETVKYSTKIDDGVCFASYTMIETNGSDPEELAQIGLQAFVNQLGADLSEAGVWKVGKNKGRMATMESEANEIEALYRVIIVGDYMYQIVIAYNNQVGIDKKVAKKFLNSFKLTK